MSAHGPYVLQDGPTRKFWRDFDGAVSGAATGEWITALADASRYATKSDAEFARANRRIGIGRAAMARLHIVPICDAREYKPRQPQPAHTAATT